MLENNLTAKAIYDFPMPPTDRAGWEKIVEDSGWSDELVVSLLKTLDAQAMKQTITYGMAWNQDEAERFFTQKGFAACQSLPLPADDSYGQMQMVMRACRFLAAQYQLDPDNKEKARQLTSFLNIVFGSIFQEQRQALNLRHGGLVLGDDGRYHVTCSRIEQVCIICVRTADKYNTDPNELFLHVMDATAGGWNVLAGQAVSNYQTSPAFRAALIEVGKFGRDEVYFDAIRLAHPLAVIMVKCGLDINRYLKAFGYPTYEELVIALDQIAGENQELAKALKQEAPQIFQSGGEALATDAIAESAIICGFPEKPETQQTLAEGCQQIENFIADLLPVSGPDTPAVILWPTAIGARTRGVNITYYNPADQQANVIIMDPRTQVTRKAEIRGHEEAHRIHAMVVTAGEKAGVFPAMAWEKIPAGNKEWFALGVGESVRECFAVVNPVRESKSSGLSTALAVAHQPGFARVQLESWKYLCSSDPNRVLSDQEVMTLVHEQTRIVKQVAPIRVGEMVLIRPDAHPLGFFAPARPTDGLVYCVHRAQAKTQTTQQGSQPLIQPLEELMASLFAGDKQWLKRPEARHLLVIGMIVSATAPDGVIDEIRACAADPQRLRQHLETLSSWGVTVG